MNAQAGSRCLTNIKPHERVRYLSLFCAYWKRAESSQVGCLESPSLTELGIGFLAPSTVL